MINPRLINWKPETSGSGEYLNAPSTGLCFLYEDRNGDHGYSFRDAGTGNRNTGFLEVARPWRAAEGNG